MLTLDQLGITEEDWNQTPASVRAALMFLIQQNQRLENRCATYELQVQRLEAELQRLKKLELEVAQLRERLGQNSQNSSKPPSSDPPSVSRPNNRQPSGRKRGGQPGHQGRARKLLPVEEVDTVIELRPTACQRCGSLLLGDDPDPARHQVSEIPPVKSEVTEYRQHRLSCPDCGEVTAAEWPKEMPRGNFGPRAQAIVGYLTGRPALSHRDVVEATEALHGLSLGLGSVSAIHLPGSGHWVNFLYFPIEAAGTGSNRQLPGHPQRHHGRGVRPLPSTRHIRGVAMNRETDHVPAEAGRLRPPRTVAKKESGND